VYSDPKGTTMAAYNSVTWENSAQFAGQAAFDVVLTGGVGGIARGGLTRRAATGTSLRAVSASKGAGSLTALGTKFSAVELNAATDVAKMGRNVVMKDPTGARSAAGATADLLVDGLPMDIYSPEAGTSVNNIFRTMAKKNNQAQGIVLDLNMWGGSLDDLGDVTGRLQGKLSAQGSAVNIQEVIVVGR